MFCFDGRALAAEQELSHELIDTDEVVVHHGNKQTSATDVFEGNVEGEVGIENWTECLLVYDRFLLLNSLSISQQPDLNVGICEQQTKEQLHQLLIRGVHINKF